MTAMERHPARELQALCRQSQRGQAVLDHTPRSASRREDIGFCSSEIDARRGASFGRC